MVNSLDQHGHARANALNHLGRAGTHLEGLDVKALIGPGGTPRGEIRQDCCPVDLEANLTAFQGRQGGIEFFADGELVEFVFAHVEHHH